MTRQQVKFLRDIIKHDGDCGAVDSDSETLVCFNCPLYNKSFEFCNADATPKEKRLRIFKETLDKHYIQVMLKKMLKP